MLFNYGCLSLLAERARPYLLTAESSEHATDFINAVYVDVSSFFFNQKKLCPMH